MNRYFCCSLLVVVAMVGCTKPNGMVVAQISPSSPEVNDAVDDAVNVAELQRIVVEQKEIIEEDRKLIREYKALIREQQTTIKRLQELTKSIDSKAETTMLTSTPKNEVDWHKQQITRNQEAYASIRAALRTIHEKNLPTTRTWYGPAWKKLTASFREGRFPSATDRDALVKLMADIQQAESRRVAVLARTNPKAAERTRASLPLASTWASFKADLAKLQY